MRRTNIVALILNGSLAINVAASAQEGRPGAVDTRTAVLQRLLKQSDVVFAGTVRSLDIDVGPAAAGVPMISMSIEDFLRKEPSLSVKKGDAIAVDVKDFGLVRVGARAIVFASVWLVGETVAVKEQGHELLGDDSSGSIERLRAEIARAESQNLDDRLRLALANSDAVVVGKVTEIRLAPAAAGPATRRRISEHAPDWKEAVIEVSKRVKGAQPVGAGAETQKLVVRFPASRDIAWARAPKLKVGEEKTFVLQKGIASGAPKAMVGPAEVAAFTVTDQFDILSPADLTKVEKLLSQDKPR